MNLENNILRVTFFDSFPLIKKYHFKPTQRELIAQNETASFIINGKPAPWKNFEISPSKQENVIIYTCVHRQNRFSLILEFSLDSFTMLIKLSVEDPESFVNHIYFTHYPLISICEPHTSLIRQYWLRKPLWSKYGRWMFKYVTLKSKLLWAAQDIIHPRFMVHGCAVIPNEVCCAVYSNFRVKPIFIRVKRCGLRKYAELGAYQYSPIIRGNKQPPLQVKIAFLQDYNQDGKISDSDYYYWLNHQLPRNFQNIHKDRMWFKIFCSNKKVGIATTLNQVREIIKAFYNITDGFPLTAFLVGWQMNPNIPAFGHDQDYPRLKNLNSKLGTKEDYWQLFEDMKRYNTIMSCHINIDDAYKSSTGWDESIICTEKDGTPFRWEEYNNEQCYHISHTKDIESGKIFQRLKEFFESLPVEKMIHIDAMRNSNLNWEESDFISAIDELYAGLIPIFEYLKEKGIEVSMEGLDFHPTEYAGLVSGTWHHEIDRNQSYFGNLVGGGFNKLSDYKAGLAWNIHQDISWERFQDWDNIRDEIFTSILSRYLLKHEMKSVKFLPFHMGYDIIFSEEMYTRVRFNKLEISKQGYDIVKNDTYMIPFKDKIYIYSKRSGQMAIRLPLNWKTLDFKVYELSKSEKIESNEFHFDTGIIFLNLKSRCPILLKKDEN